MLRLRVLALGLIVVVAASCGGSDDSASGDTAATTPAADEIGPNPNPTTTTTMPATTTTAPPVLGLPIPGWSRSLRTVCVTADATYSGVDVPAEAFVDRLSSHWADPPVVGFRVPDPEVDYGRVEFVAGDDPDCDATLRIEFTGEGLPVEYRRGPTGSGEPVTVYSGRIANGRLELSASGEAPREIPIAVQRDGPDHIALLPADYVWDDAEKTASGSGVVDEFGLLSEVFGCQPKGVGEGPVCGEKSGVPWP